MYSQVLVFLISVKILKPQKSLFKKYKHKIGKKGYLNIVKNGHCGETWCLYIRGALQKFVLINCVKN